MPKLKPLSKDDELLAIPVDEPVLVELEPAGDEGAGIVQPEDKPEKPLKVEREEKPEGEADDGVKALQKQMADMAAANATETARIARERDAALRERDEARTQAADTEADLIQNGLTSAQSEEKAARAALKAARDLGDVDAEADAVARIGRAATDVRDFERAAAQLAERKPEAPAQRQDNPDINATIDAMALLPAEKTWLKAHPEAMVDPRQRTRLDAAYYDATEKGIVRGTPEYFEFVEERLGYKKREESREEPEERPVMPAAPVSRDSRSPSGRRQATRVELTPVERQFARDMGISDVAYAKGKLQLAANKAADPEKYARTS